MHDYSSRLKDRIKELEEELKIVDSVLASNINCIEGLQQENEQLQASLDEALMENERFGGFTGIEIGTISYDEKIGDLKINIKENLGNEETIKRKIYDILVEFRLYAQPIEFQEPQSLLLRLTELFEKELAPNQKSQQ